MIFDAFPNRIRTAFKKFSSSISGNINTNIDIVRWISPMGIRFSGWWPRWEGQSHTCSFLHQQVFFYTHSLYLYGAQIIFFWCPNVFFCAKSIHLRSIIFFLYSKIKFFRTLIMIFGAQKVNFGVPFI